MPKREKAFVTKEQLEEITGFGWTPGPHTHIKSDITDLPWSWTDVLKAGSNLTDLATRQHAGLSDAPADAHHPQSHTLASHSTKPHSALTDITSGQHHAQLHGSSHHSGGGDAIKLDDLATPNDNIDLNVSISRHGLFPKLSNHPAQCLSGIGQWLTLYDATSIIIQILSGASGTTRNTNNTERSNTATEYTKIKETKLGEPTGVMRIYFELKKVGGVPAANVIARIYLNGGAIGTTRTSNTGTYEAFSEDLGGFDSQDLIQIYAYKGGCDTVYVKNLRFKYDRAITMLGECVLTTPIAIATQNPFSMQNQDP